MLNRLGGNVANMLLSGHFQSGSTNALKADVLSAGQVLCGLQQLLAQAPDRMLNKFIQRVLSPTESDRPWASEAVCELSAGCSCCHERSDIMLSTAGGVLGFMFQSVV